MRGHYSAYYGLKSASYLNSAGRPGRHLVGHQNLYFDKDPQEICMYMKVERSPDVGNHLAARYESVFKGNTCRV